jgi:hypothetical protein
MFRRCIKSSTLPFLLYSKSVSCFLGCGDEITKADNLSLSIYLPVSSTGLLRREHQRRRAVLYRYAHLHAYVNGYLYADRYFYSHGYPDYHVDADRDASGLLAITDPSRRPGIASQRRSHLLLVAARLNQQLPTEHYPALRRVDQFPDPRHFPPAILGSPQHCRGIPLAGQRLRRISVRDLPIRRL